MEANIRGCIKCGEIKPHGRGQGYCKDCRNSARKYRYLTDPVLRAKEIKQSSVRQSRIYERNYRIIRMYKTRRGCVDCGELDFCCLDFDHRDKESKSFTIAQCMTKHIKAIIREARKCDVRCSNCHRKRHWYEDNFVTL